jgi:hypothetical protein
MDAKELAALKRKHAAIEDPAKKSEFAHMLRMAGEDPDEIKEVAPEGRTASKKVTAEESKPTTAKTEAKPAAASRPARPAAKPVSKAKTAPKDK